MLSSERRLVETPRMLVSPRTLAAHFRLLSQTGTALATVSNGMTRYFSVPGGTPSGRTWGLAQTRGTDAPAFHREISAIHGNQRAVIQLDASDAAGVIAGTDAILDPSPILSARNRQD
jgi:hypothetical protein